MNNTKRMGYTLVAVAAFWLNSSAIAATTYYKVTEIGAPGTVTYAGGLNDLGVVSVQVGGSNMLYNSNSGTLSSAPLYGRINNAGQIAATVNERAYYYDGSTVKDLGTLGGSYSRAYGLNDSGQVVGYSFLSNGLLHGYVSSNGGPMVDLGAFDGNISMAADINASGHITGISSAAGTSAGQTFLYSGGVMHNLGAFGALDSFANAINDNDQVVGYAAYNYGRRGYIYDAGSVVFLGAFGIGGGSEASDINNAGVVVGGAQDNLGNYRAFVYSDGVMSDLNTLLVNGISGGQSLSWASAINERGQILAASGSRAFLLTPVPVPAAAWMMGSALLGLFGLRTRR